MTTAPFQIELDPRIAVLRSKEMVIALWVGGPQGKEFNKICRNLAAYGIEVIDRWDSDEACRHKHVPSRANLVLVNRDLIRHTAFDHIKKITEADSKPFIPVNLSLMNTLKQLRAHNVPLKLSQEAKLDEEDMLNMQTQSTKNNGHVTPKTMMPVLVTEPPKPSKTSNEKIYEDKVLKIAKKFAGEDGDPSQLLLFVRPEMERGSIRLVSILDTLAPSTAYRIEPKFLSALAVSGVLNVSTFANEVGVAYGTAQKVFFRAATLGLIERVEPFSDGGIRGDEPTFSLNVKATDALMQMVGRELPQEHKTEDLTVTQVDGVVQIWRKGNPTKTRPVLVGNTLFESTTEASLFLELDKTAISKRLSTSEGVVQINGFDVFYPSFQQVLDQLSDLKTKQKEPTQAPIPPMPINGLYTSPFNCGGISIIEEDGTVFALVPKSNGSRTKAGCIMLDETLYLSVNAASLALGLSPSGLGQALNKGALLKKGLASYRGKVVRWPTFQMACHLLHSGRAKHEGLDLDFPKQMPKESSLPITATVQPPALAVDVTRVFEETFKRVTLPAPSQERVSVKPAQSEPESLPAVVHPDLTYLSPADQGEVMTALKLLMNVLKDCKNAKYHSVHVNVETGEVEVNVTSTRKHTFKL